MYQLQLFNSYKIGAQIRPSPVSRAEIQAKGEPGKNPAVAEPVTSQLEWRLWTAEMATVSEKVSGSHPGNYFLADGCDLPQQPQQPQQQGLPLHLQGRLTTTARSDWCRPATTKNLHNFKTKTYEKINLYYLQLEIIFEN